MTSPRKKAEIPLEVQALRRIEELLALIARTVLSDRLDEILSDRNHRLLLEETGKLPVSQLAKKTGLSTGTISRLWQKWEQIGLLVKDGKQYRRVL
ncbi:MAG TPA: helix-turn-helix domain-containing protein [Acidobacteriota bacterium]